MLKYLAVLSFCWIFLLGSRLEAQQFDVAVGGGSLYAQGGTYNGGALPTESGGPFLGFSTNYLFKRNLGVQGEVNWRVTQGLYANQIPYRPVFWAFNAMYYHEFNNRISLEVLGGGGGQNVRFYSGTFNCDINGNCTNYVSSNHLMVDGGAGIRLYFFHNFFVRPEARLYFVPNNNNGGTATTHPGFSSTYPVRYGAFLGYTFGSRNKNK